MDRRQQEVMDMHALRRMTRPVAVSTRTMLALILGVTAVIVGMLSMHVLAGEPAAPHGGAPHSEVQASAVEAAHHPGTLDCAAGGCDGMGAMAASCMLALIALALALRITPVRWTLSSAAPPPAPSSSPGRARLRPSLVELSISRT